MAISPSRIALLREQLGGLGPVMIRRMFGGAGIYADGVMFALADDEVLYFKADEKTARSYAAEGLGPFVYQGKVKPITMSYWQVPDRLFDEPDEMLDWALQALAVARAAAVKKAKRAGADSE